MSPRRCVLGGLTPAGDSSPSASSLARSGRASQAGSLRERACRGRSSFLSVPAQSRTLRSHLPRRSPGRGPGEYDRRDPCGLAIVRSPRRAAGNFSQSDNRPPSRCPRPSLATRPSTPRENCHTSSSVLPGPARLPGEGGAWEAGGKRTFRATRTRGRYSRAARAVMRRRSAGLGHGPGGPLPSATSYSTTVHHGRYALDPLALMVLSWECLTHSIVQNALSRQWGAGRRLFPSLAWLSLPGGVGAARQRAGAAEAGRERTRETTVGSVRNHPNLSLRGALLRNSPMSCQLFPEGMSNPSSVYRYRIRNWHKYNRALSNRPPHGMVRRTDDRRLAAHRTDHRIGGTAPLCGSGH